MKAYSLDLRERVAAACGQPGGRVAAQFSVSVSFVEKLLHRQRAAGSVAALPPRNGPAPRLEAPARQQLRACLRQQPDATLEELRTWLAALGGPAGSQSTLCRAVQALEWRRKKSVHAAARDTERVVALRRAFVEALQAADFICFKSAS